QWMRIIGIRFRYTTTFLIFFSVRVFFDPFDEILLDPRHFSVADIPYLSIFCLITSNQYVANNYEAVDEYKNIPSL
ncbi:hypothetical protein, partial [Pectobacterium versatile]|uniref:hypothetical protein n=1 Tax=Pectobacterium versatile TaxID=2488639 RepID=UPI0020BFD698